MTATTVLVLPDGSLGRVEAGAVAWGCDAKDYEGRAFEGVVIGMLERRLNGS